MSVKLPLQSIFSHLYPSPEAEEPATEDPAKPAALEEEPPAEPESAIEAEAVGENVSGVPLGVYVLFPKNVGLPVPWDETLRLVSTAEIVAIVEEIEDVDAQGIEIPGEDFDRQNTHATEHDEEQH